MSAIRPPVTEMSRHAYTRDIALFGALLDGT